VNAQKFSPVWKKISPEIAFNGKNFPRMENNFLCHNYVCGRIIPPFELSAPSASAAGIIAVCASVTARRVACVVSIESIAAVTTVTAVTAATAVAAIIFAAAEIFSDTFHSLCNILQQINGVLAEFLRRDIAAADDIHGNIHITSAGANLIHHIIGAIFALASLITGVPGTIIIGTVHFTFIHNLTSLYPMQSL